eukprot:7053898-Prymnesium_polylepis.1
MVEAAERVRGPPCVALQSKECQDDPSRQKQYTFVPPEYRANSTSARACADRSTATATSGVKGEPGKPGDKAASSEQALAQR